MRAKDRPQVCLDDALVRIERAIHPRDFLEPAPPTEPEPNAAAEPVTVLPVVEPDPEPEEHQLAAIRALIELVRRDMIAMLAAHQPGDPPVHRRVSHGLTLALAAEAEVLRIEQGCGEHCALAAVVQARAESAPLPPAIFSAG